MPTASHSTSSAVAQPANNEPALPEPTSLTWNILWLYALQGLNYIAPLILLPYLVRVLGAERYGLLAFSQSVAQYFVIATDYGFNYSGTRAIATNRGSRPAVNRIFWTLMTVKTLLLFLGVFVMAALLIWIPRFRSEPLIYAAAYLSVVGSVVFPQWLFQGMESMRSMSIISGLTKIAAVISVILFVHRPADTLLAAVLLSSGQLIAGVIAAFVGVRRYAGRFVRPGPSSIKGALTEGRHLFLTTASISLFTNTNMVLVGLIAGNTAAGYFSLAEKLARATTGAIGPVLQAAYPHTICLINESKSAALRFLRRAIGFGGVLGAIAGLGIFLFARFIARVAFGGSAPEVLVLVRWTAIFPFWATLNGILGTLVLIPFGCDKPVSRLVFTAALVNISVGSLLIWAAGALGGVIGMILIEGFLFVGNLVVLSRERISLFHAYP